MGRKAALLRFVLALALLLGSAFSFEPVTDSKFPVYMSPSLNGNRLSTKVTYINLSYFSKPYTGNYPPLDPTDPRFVDFFKPPSNLRPYSVDSFSTHIDDAAGREVYFSYNEGPIAGCYPIISDAAGLAQCTAVNYFKTGYGIVPLASETSCGVVKIEFRGAYAGANYLGPVSRMLTMCPGTNSAASSLGGAIYTALGSNLAFCFPVFLIGGLLIASMYYSGKDPLSLFDLTTPRLPRVRQFRVKAGTAPQMMRSITRRYMMIQRQAEKSIIAVAMMAAAGKADEAGLKDRAKAEYVRSRVNEIKKVLRSYGDDLKAANSRGKPLNEQQLLARLQSLRNLFDSLKPDEKRAASDMRVKMYSERWNQGSNMIAGWLQLHQMSEQAMRITADSRGGSGGGRISKRIGKGLEAISKKAVAFEESPAVRFVSRIPILGGIVTGPSKTFDSFMQYRASRRGAKTLRREIWGAMLYNLVYTSKDKDQPGARKLNVIGRTMKAAFEKTDSRGVTLVDAKNEKLFTPLGSLTKWWNSWSFSKFEEKANLNSKKANDILNGVEEMRKQSAYSLNAWFLTYFNSLKAALPLADSPEKAREALEQDLSRLQEQRDRLMGRLRNAKTGSAEKKSIAGNLRETNALIKALDGDRRANRLGIIARIEAARDNETLRNGLRDEIEQLVKKNKSGLYSANKFLQNSKYYAGELDRISEMVRGGLSYSEALGRSHDLVSQAKNNRQIASTPYDEATFTLVLSNLRTQEDRVKSMMAYRLNGIYLPATFEEIEKFRGHNTDADARARYGSLAGMSKDQFAAALNSSYNQLMRDMENKTTVSAALLKLSQEANDRARPAGYKNEQEFASQLLKMNLYGSYPVGFYLTERLRAMGIRDETGAFGKKGDFLVVKSMDDLELLFKKGVPSEVNRFNRELQDRVMQGMLGEQLRQQLTKASTESEKARVREGAYHKMVADAGNFARLYEAKLLGTVTVMTSADKGERNKWLGDFLGTSAYRKVWDLIEPHKSKEVALQLSDFKKTQYEKDTEVSMQFARSYDQLAGFVVWKNTPGGAWGENSFGRLQSVLEKSREDFMTTRAAFLNLVDPSSKFYDRAFVERLQSRKLQLGELSAENYLELIGRGRTFGDMKRGLPFIISGDMRGGTFIVEHDEKVLRAQGKGVIIGKEGDIRDLTPIMARLQESKYINLPSGMVVLIRHEDAKGNATFLYGDPKKDPNVAAMLGSAESNINLRPKLGATLAGYDPETGVYDRSKQRLMVLSASDFTSYAKANEGGFFGNMTAADRMRERVRASYLAAGQKGSEILYSGLTDRVNKMHSWFTAQMQIRFALESLTTHATGFMTEGNTRFAKSEDAMDSIYRRDTDGKIVLDAAGKKIAENAAIDALFRSTRADSHQNNKEHSVGDIFLDRVDEMKHGDNTLLGNASATWWNFRRSIASNTLAPIAQAESAWYTAKLELKAAEKLYKEGTITSSEYRTLRGELQPKVDEYKKDYKQAMKDYGEMAKIMVGWTGSHTFGGTPYGSTKNAFSMVWIFNKYLDSKWVQGQQDEFYQVAESSTMRDPRSAIGAGPGLDYSFYVGYQTGQNVYERSSFWATSSLWERNMQNKLLPTIGVHKWFNDYMSYAARKSSAYPAWFEMDPMYPGRPGSRNLAAGFLAPFQSHYHSDYFQARAQNFLNYSGAGSLIGAYLDTGSQVPGERNFFRKMMDWAFIPSAHYTESAVWRGLQRPLDKFQEFDDRLSKAIKRSPEYRDAYNRWAAEPEGSADKQQIWDKYFKPLADTYDSRPLGVREGHSGRDIQEDGSRNRFMQLYAGFHSNVWRPIIPAMLDVDRISGRWIPYPQISAQVARAPSTTGMERLASMGTFMLSSPETYTDKATGKEKIRMISVDQFHTQSDAYRDVYKRTDTGLLHLAKLQNETQMYSFLNSPAIYFFHPGLGLASRVIGRLARNTKAASNISAHAMSQDTELVYGLGKMKNYDQFVEQVSGYSLSDLAGIGGGNRARASFLARAAMRANESFESLAQRTEYLPELVSRRKKEMLDSSQDLAEKR